jgi:hypothetical protein
MRSFTLLPRPAQVVCFAVALTAALSATGRGATLYSLDASQDATGDFRLAQIGNNIGGEGEQAHQNFSHNASDSALELTGRYNQDRTVVLDVPLDTPPSGWLPGYIAGDVAVAMTFGYANSSSASNSDVILSLRQAVGNTSSGAGFNTYPNYFVRLLDNETFTLNRYSGYSTIVELASQSISGLSGSSSYDLTFSAIDDGGSVVLTAELFEDGSSRRKLSFTDSSPIAGGYVGIGGGQGSVNNGTFEGILVSGFDVSTVAAVPEPASLGLLFAAAAMACVCRRRW